MQGGEAMKNKNEFTITAMIVIAIFLTACTPPGDPGVNNKVEIEELQSAMGVLEQENEALLATNKGLEAQLDNYLSVPGVSNPTNTQNLINTAYSVMNLIKEKDMASLSNYVHPTQGLRFTPLVHINVSFDQKFTAQEVANLDLDTRVYDWGYYYGGPPETSIIMDFNEYYDEFIYDKDFLNANRIGVNSLISFGLIIDNIAEFPNAQYLEFYIQGAEHSQGFYWESLKLVFEESGGILYLIGIVHGQWSDDYGVE